MPHGKAAEIANMTRKLIDVFLLNLLAKLFNQV